MMSANTEVKEVLQLLEATPGRLKSITRNLERPRLNYKFESEPWSINDILAHLRACSDVWGKSIIAMIEQDHPTMRYVSPRTWIRKTDYLTLEFHSSLQAFTGQREGLLRSLKMLKPQGWSRGATFTATTRGREHTVLSYARRIVEHEVEHCAQIEGLLGSMPK